MNAMVMMAMMMMTVAIDDSNLINLSICSRKRGAGFADKMVKSTHFKFHFLSNHHSQKHPMEN